MPVERNWTILEQPLVVRDDDHDELTEAVFEAIAILRRVGGTIQIASQRVEIAKNVGVTESFVFAYNSFTPIVRRAGEPPQPEPVQAIADGDLEGDGDLTADEMAQHFPDAGGLQEAVDEIAAAEQPAVSEPAVAVE